MLEIIAPGNDVCAGDDAELLRMLDANEALEVTQVIGILPLGAGQWGS